MKIINLLINEDVLKAATELESANIDNVVERSREYLEMLSQYRNELHELGGIPDIGFAGQTRLGRELVEQSRKAVRAAIELTVGERNRVESLLQSFTLINGSDAAETFNRLRHKDMTGWELSGGSVGVSGNGERISIEEAVATAGLLRRTAFINDKITFFR